VYVPGGSAGPKLAFEYELGWQVYWFAVAVGVEGVQLPSSLTGVKYELICVSAAT
jgi:hypothetical protein